MKSVFGIIALLLIATTPLLAAERGVLAELFTATWWTYCPWAEAALDKIAGEKGLDTWVPVAWHSSGSDPYFTAEAATRNGYYGVSGYPTCIFNGTLWSVGGSSATYDNYLAMYEYCRRTPSPLTIEYMSHSFSGTKASISVKIKLEETVAAGHSVYFVLWEDDLHYSGRNFYFVERALANPETLTVKDPNEEQIIKREFTVGSGWNTANLGVSVFVQNPSSKAVLQARAVRLVEGVDVDATSFGRVKALYN